MPLTILVVVVSNNVWAATAANKVNNRSRLYEYEGGQERAIYGGLHSDGHTNNEEEFGGLVML